MHYLQLLILINIPLPNSIQLLLLHIFLKFSWALFNHCIVIINMDSIDFGYSMKNIPTFKKIILFIQNHWQSWQSTQTYEMESTIFWQRSSELKCKCQHINTFSLKIRNCPPQIQDMKEFEKDIQTMIEYVKFHLRKINFRKKLKEDLKLINSSKNIFLSADKAKNFYEITKEDYEKIIH